MTDAVDLVLRTGQRYQLTLTRHSLPEGVTTEGLKPKVVEVISIMDDGMVFLSYVSDSEAVVPERRLAIPPRRKILSVPIERIPWMLANGIWIEEPVQAPEQKPYANVRYLMILHDQNIWMTFEECARALNGPARDGRLALDLDTGMERRLFPEEARAISSLSDDYAGMK